MNIHTKKYLEYLSNETFSIYLFHGVIDKNNFQVRNYNAKHLETAFFQKLIEELKSAGNPVSMDDIRNAYITKKSLPPKSFAITFDDGFENNLTVAAPILEKYSVPATFYVTSGFIENNQMSWIDQIDYAIEQTQVPSIQLSFLDKEYQLNSDANKIAMLEQIRKTLKNKSNLFEKLEQYIQEVFEKTNVSFLNSFNSNIDQKMDWDQVQELSSSSLFTLGAHTETHPIMSFLSDEQLEKEIQQPIGKLKDILNKEITHFSYPEGLEHCYNDNVINKLKEHGVTCCPTAIHGVNSSNTNLFHLKRITVV